MSPNQVSETEDSGSEDFQSFDDFGISDDSHDSSEELENGDDWGTPIAAPKAAKIENHKSTDQVKNLDAKEGDLTEDGVEMKEEKKDDSDEKEEKEEESDKANVEEIAVAAPVGKILKAKLGDSEVGIDDAAVVKVKVDGKNIDVPIKELISNFSGQQNWDKKNSEFAAEKKNFTANVEKVRAYETHLKSNMEGITAKVKAAVEGKGHPLEAMNQLLDLLGEDSFVYYKKTMESLFDEFNSLYDMSEPEQDAFWARKENEHLKKVQTKTVELQGKEQARQKQVAQVEAVQNEFGIGWNEFTEAHQYLTELKDENGKPLYSQKALFENPRAVAQYAARMPHITKAEDLAKPFVENMDDDDYSDFVDTASGLLQKGVSSEQITEWLSKNYGVSPAVKVLNQKLNAGGTKQMAKQATEISKYKAKTKRPLEEDDAELFGDFED